MADKKATPSFVKERLARINFILEDSKTEAIVITDVKNIRYLTGFSGSAATLVVFSDKLHFVTDDRYEEQLEGDLYDLPNLHTHITRDFWTYLKENGILEGVKSMLFEADKMPYAVAVETRNIIRPIKFKPTESTIDLYMVPKDPVEVGYIKQACEMAERVFEKAVKKIKTGITEAELAAEVAYISRLEGSEGDPFDIIVLSGSRTSLPHGRPSPDKKIKKNELVLFDFGCKVNGFGSDITRTVCFGKPTKEMQSTYETLYKAQSAAIEMMRPFMKGMLVDQKVRDILAEEKLEEFYKHSLGHGIGLTAHERPIISARREDENLPDNSVLAVEPGVYHPGKWGIRIEDNVHLTIGGCERLTNVPEQLPVV